MDEKSIYELPVKKILDEDRVCEICKKKGTIFSLHLWKDGLENPSVKWLGLECSNCGWEYHD